MLSKKGGVNWVVIGLILMVVVLVILISFYITRWEAISGLISGAEERAVVYDPAESFVNFIFDIKNQISF